MYEEHKVKMCTETVRNFTVLLILKDQKYLVIQKLVFL